MSSGAAREHGHAGRVGGKLVFSSATRAEHEIDPARTAHFVSISRGPRRYLADETALAALASGVLRDQARRKSATLHAFLRDEDQKRPVSGLPALPPHLRATAWASLSPKERVLAIVELALPEPSAALSRSKAKRLRR